MQTSIGMVHGQRRIGVPGGIHMGAGNLTNMQFTEAKRVGVPAVIRRCEDEDQRFEHLKTLCFRVPEDYTPDDPTLAFLNKGMAAGYKPTVSLEPGRCTRVDLYELNGPTLEDCLDLIEEKDGLLVGPGGLLLCWIALGEKLPRSYWFLSLDKKEALGKDAASNYILPSIFKSPAPEMMKHDVHSIRVSGPLSIKNCLMVFTYDDTGEGIE